MNTIKIEIVKQGDIPKYFQKNDKTFELIFSDFVFRDIDSGREFQGFYVTCIDELPNYLPINNGFGIIRVDDIDLYDRIMKLICESENMKLYEIKTPGRQKRKQRNGMRRIKNNSVAHIKNPTIS